MAEPKPDLQRLFQEARYQDAKEILLSNPRGDNAAYHYNLGTVYLKLGAPGPALAHLEKATRLKRHEPAFQQNLQLARAEVAKTLGAERLDPASSGVERLADHVSIDEVRGTIGLLVLLLSLLWLRAYVKSRTLRRTFLQPASLLVLCALGITFSLYGAQRYTESHPPAVLLEARAVRSGPGNSYLELARLEAGVKVRVMNQTGAPEEGAAGTPPATWLQVRFSPEEIGWIPASSMLLL